MNSLVSIGMPVYNGEIFLREALDSLLAQDYTNFELIISDNASTDSTAEICREYAALDSRIKYYRAEQNKGASWNFNRVLELSNGEFFVWAAHDDLWDSNFISKCVAALSADQKAVVCHSLGQNIRADKSPVGEPLGNLVNEEDTMRGRWSKTHENWNLHAAIYGLIRTKIAKRILPLETYASCDLVYIAQLSLYGKIIQIQEILQYNRLPAALVKRYESPEGMMEYLGAKSIRPVKMHRFQVMRRCIEGLKHAKLSYAQLTKLTLDIFFIYLKRQFSVDFKELVKSKTVQHKNNQIKTI